MTSGDAIVSFDALVLTLATTAAVHFGDVADPATGQKGVPNLRAAAQVIDLLALLEQKTRGNLTDEEERFLEEVLFELRVRFVETQQGEVQKGGDRSPTTE